MAEEEGFVENDLLRVWQEFSVPSEVSLLNPSSWDEGQGNEGWQEKVVCCWGESPGGPETNNGEISVSPFKSPVSLLTLIEENSVLVGLHSVEVGVSINNWAW